MSFYSCAVCFDPLPNSQRHTCGTKRCLDQWKEWAKFAPEKRRAQKNLSTMSPTERAHVLAQGPSIEELEATAIQREALNNDVEEYQQQQQKKHDSGFLPKTLRDMLLTNAPLAKDLKSDPDPKEALDTNGDPIATDASDPDSTDT